MANFNGYPVNMYQPDQYYQPVQPQYNPSAWRNTYTTSLPSYQQNIVPVSQPNNPMVWVQGIAAAKAYLVPNNSTAILWDSESQTVYIKSVDANGRPSLTILDYTERDENAVVNESKGEKEFVTMDKFSDQLELVNEKIKSFDGFATSKQFETLVDQINTLSGQVSDIENRILSFGKPQQNTQNRKGKMQ